MECQLVALPDSEGQLLAAAILEQSGKKILARGHRMERSDVQLLRQKGVGQVWVVELGAADRSECEVLSSLTPGVANGPVEMRQAAGGRVDLLALEPSALILRPERMQAFNTNGAAVISTLPNFAFLSRRERFATVRSRPFSAPAVDVERLKADLASDGPLMTIQPIRESKVAVIYTDPANPERARELFEPITRRRMERFGVTSLPRTSLEEEASLTSVLADVLRRPVDVILIASTISPFKPTDAIGRAVQAVGGSDAYFMAPVEPGSLLLLSYAGPTAIVVATGCFRSPKPNVLDLILPPLLARHRLSSADIASLGPGGLLG
jgi:molybdenum cofactor cytidylyltransferase